MLFASDFRRIARDGLTPYTSAAKAAFYFDVARDFHPYGIPRNN